MPYLIDGRKKELMTEPNRACTDGDFNYLFTLAYLKVFTANPAYKTIALIRKASLTPTKLQEVEAVENQLTVAGVTLLDRIVARDLAFAEFYARVGSVYEAYARANNGDLPEYQEAGFATLSKFKEETTHN